MQSRKRDQPPLKPRRSAEALAKAEGTKRHTKKNRRAFAFLPLLGCILIAVAAVPLAQSAKPVTYKGLEMSVAGVERAPTASLKDCPPGGNTVNATTRPGEEFAVVKINFKVLPAFQPNTMLKRPVVTDESGKTYNTAVSFVDVGSTPEFACAIPFRVPTGTMLKSLQIDSATLEIPASKH
jgi:hypothetical protein